MIGFVTKHDKRELPRGALDVLARRAGLDLKKLMEERPRVQRDAARRADAAAGRAARLTAASLATAPLRGACRRARRVVEHYHRTFCEREDAQEYLRKRGLTDARSAARLKVGYADGSLLKRAPEDGELREQLQALGVITAEGRELLGGCIVVPIPDPLTGQWTNLYGRGLRTPRHCYLPGPLRGVLNFQAARSFVRGHPHRVDPRRALVPPGRHLDGDPDLRHERLHRRTTSTRSSARA